MFGWIRWRLRRRSPYRIHTSEFDEQVRAADLLNSPEAEAFSPPSDDILSNRLRDAMADAGDGLRPDDQVILLLDQSGSMRGRRILVAALIVDEFARRLAAAGVRHEVLGFTTVGWKGGRSRERWIVDGARSRPGRLCDLRHIVYKGFDEDELWRATLPLMTSDILREGVDGEAVQWAVSRFAHGDGRKMLIQIGDGSPNDDSTLKENGPWFLEDHFLKVLGELPERGVRYSLLSFEQWKMPIPHQYLGEDGALAPSVCAQALAELTARPVRPR